MSCKEGRPFKEVVICQVIFTRVNLVAPWGMEGGRKGEERRKIVRVWETTGVGSDWGGVREVPTDPSSSERQSNCCWPEWVRTLPPVRAPCAGLCIALLR